MMVVLLCYCIPVVHDDISLPSKTSFKELLQKTKESIHTEGQNYNPDHEAPEVLMIDLRGYIFDAITLAFDGQV